MQYLRWYNYMVWIMDENLVMEQMDTGGVKKKLRKDC